MTIKDSLLHELETLPESRQEEVLAFVRFLKIGLADPQAAAERFDDALAAARRLAAERGLSADEILAEIDAV